MPHVELLGVLFMIWGGLTMLIGASTLALGIAASSLINAAFVARLSNNWASGLSPRTLRIMAWIFDASWRRVATSSLFNAATFVAIIPGISGCVSFSAAR